MLQKTVFTVALGCLLAAPVQGQFGEIMKTLGLDQESQLSDDTVVSGLKEALQVGSGNAVESTGQLDGYLKNEAIRILMPDKLKALDKGLRMVGYGSQLDEFVVSMNRAAEKAAPFAKDIFWNAIREMSIADAHGILKGGDTAATEYFKEKTSDDLTAAFLPVVEESMQEVGVTRQYQELTERYTAIPFMKAEAVDLNQYVTGKALDGLFHVLGEQERQIRTNPAARVTDLLKKVFGG